MRKYVSGKNEKIPPKNLLTFTINDMVFAKERTYFLFGLCKNSLDKHPFIHSDYKVKTNLFVICLWCESTHINTTFSFFALSERKFWSTQFN
jgi:hypothetical protein